ncbi:pyridoxal phosphate-dependent aminotransferase [Sinorhizobium meliloti]|uniref:pyridoxal phosphate-dependent aminotransferase n=1 Tax=Rhizobium meliloti TaxID=382 RepID=UPI003D6571F0
MWRISQRIASIEASPLVALTSKIALLRRGGHDVIDLGIGEPDFDTPDDIKDAAMAAIRKGATKYTAMPGTQDLREVIVGKLLAENGLKYPPDQIIVCNGVKQVIFNAFAATLDPGDEVIVPTPYWMSYPSIVKLAGGVPVIVECDASDGFKLDPSKLGNAITDRTRWLILNSPSNPTGAVYRAEELRALANVLHSHPGVGVLSDDVYEHIRDDLAPLPVIAQAGPDLFERTLIANGVSKAYAMTGWRVGYGAGPRELIRGMIEVQAQSTSAPSSVSQAAAAAALRGPLDEVRRRASIFMTRRDDVMNWLSRAPLLKMLRPDGAFYGFVDCRPLLGKQTPDDKSLQTDADIATWLLESYHVAVLPGSAFGAPGYVRLSFAASTEQLKEACARIVRACSDLR